MLVVTLDNEKQNIYDMSLGTYISLMEKRQFPYGPSRVIRIEVVKEK